MCLNGVLFFQVSITFTVPVTDANDNAPIFESASYQTRIVPTVSHVQLQFGIFFSKWK